MTVVRGIGSQRTTSWPTIRSRRVGKPQKVPGKGLCLISAHLLQSKLQSKRLGFLQLWYSQQAAEGHAPGHPLGFDGYRQFRPIKVVVRAGGGGDNLPKVSAIAVGSSAAADGLDDDSASCFSG